VDKDSLGRVVGDVSGKGVGAALIMTMVRTAMRTEARATSGLPMCWTRSTAWWPTTSKRACTSLYYVILDSRKRPSTTPRRVHNPMILYRGSEDNIYFLNPKGFAWGCSSAT
jgi:serine phosphatase RsbU (regulator of sigma subunit)